MRYIYREYHSGHHEVLQARSLEEAVAQVEASVRSCYSTDAETIWIEGDLASIDGETVEEHPILVSIHPDAPACEGEGDHDWRSPHNLVGGLPENPGVWGKGGGVVYTEVCVRCGTARTVDTWAQGPSGQQGLRKIKYEPYLYEGELDEYIRHHGHCYAVVDRDGYVQDVVYDLREASDPQVTERMNRLAGYGSDGHRWVLVAGGPCDPGDRLDVDEEGTATLAE